MSITIRMWISNQPDGVPCDTTREYYDDAARRIKFSSSVSVTEDDERGVLITGAPEAIEHLHAELNLTLRHDPYGDDTRTVRYTWEADE